MTARVFVCLLTADASGLTAADLVHRLQVSAASVSKSIGYLAGLELVVRQLDPGGRRERYVIDDDVWLRAWQSDTSAHGGIAMAAQQGIEIFGAETTAGVRLSRMGEFFARLSQQMSGSMLAEPVVDDALTVLAALVHAGRPLALSTLGTALGWPRDRLTAALEAIQRHPAIGDPLVLRTIESPDLHDHHRTGPPQPEATPRPRRGEPPAARARPTGQSAPTARRRGGVRR